MDKENQAQVVSRTPRRTRIRVPARHRKPSELTRIVRALKERVEPEHIRSDPRTGSIVVRHRLGGLKDIEAAMNDLGIILGSATDLKPPSSGKSGVASTLTSAISDLDRRLGLATSGLIDLKTLVPLGFGALALRQLLRKGLQIEAAPWYVLAYVALDTFMNFHQTGGPRPVVEKKRTRQSASLQG